MEYSRARRAVVQTWWVGATTLALCLAVGPYALGQSSAEHQSAQAVPIGTSWKDRPITAYVLGEGAKTVVFIGGMHGDEPAGVELVRKLQSYLEQHPEAMQGARVVFLPVANPDGLAAGTRVNAHKVDVNRNFPSGDWQPKSRSDRYNPGPSEGSEPETQAVMKLLEKYGPQTVISVHAPLHMLNPTGSGVEVAKVMAEYNHYRVDTSVGYPTPGAFGTYCGTKLGKNMVTLELSDGDADSAWESNRKALLAAIAYPDKLAEPGNKQTSPVAAAAGTTGSPRAVQTVQPSAPASPAPAPDPIPASVPTAAHTSRAFPWLLLGGGIVALTVGSWLGVRALLGRRSLVEPRRSGAGRQ